MGWPGLTVSLDWGWVTIRSESRTRSWSVPLVARSLPLETTTS